MNKYKLTATHNTTETFTYDVEVNANSLEEAVEAVKQDRGRDWQTREFHGSEINSIIIDESDQEVIASSNELSTEDQEYLKDTPEIVIY